MITQLLAGKLLCLPLKLWIVSGPGIDLNSLAVDSQTVNNLYLLSSEGHKGFMDKG